jgi:hypothetical protein
LAKKCFVICPIGEEGTDIRKNADRLFNYIVTPIVRELGYDNVHRADLFQMPGLITNQIITLINEADLIIADVTENNPNVFYELGFSNTRNKPTILMKYKSSEIPFDIQNSRIIFFDFDIESVEKAKEELRDQIKSIEKNGEFYNPINIAFSVQKMQSSNDPLKYIISEMYNEIKEIKKMVMQMDRQKDETLHSKVPIPEEIDSSRLDAIEKINKGLDYIKSYDNNISISKTMDINKHQHQHQHRNNSKEITSN